MVSGFFQNMNFSICLSFELRMYVSVHGLSVVTSETNDRVKVAKQRGQRCG